jgi:uncharacterized membrane-anchored protein YhcB (DUF1043 family)
MSEKVTYLKQGAVIPLQIGSLFLQRLQKLSVFLLQDKTEEELDAFREKVDTNSIQEGTWEFHFETVAVLIKTLEEAAIQEGLIEEKEV